MAHEPSELRRHIQSLPTESVWRPVHDHRGILLRRGGGKFVDILAETLDGVRLADRSVADLGCNLGAYSLLVAQNGAARVLGVDIDPKVIQGCRLLARDFGLGQAEFKVADFLKERLGETFDLCLLIDFIGRSVVAKGRLQDCVQAVACTARHELLLTLRPEYAARDELGCDPDQLARLYPGRFIRHGRFQVLEYVAESLGPSWQLHTDRPGRFSKYNLKTRVRGFRRG